MRIAIDARAAAEVPAGRGRYLRELLRSLARLDVRHEFLLLARRQWECPELDDRFTWRLLHARDPIWALTAARAAPHNGDVLLATDSYLLAAAARMPAVAVVQDLVAFSRENRPPRGSLLERLTLPLAVRRAQAFLCASEATRRELVSRFPAADARARVVRLGVEPRFAGANADGVPARYGINGSYVLVTGTLEPRKNLPRAIDGFLALPDDLRRSYELVLVGARGWRMRALEEKLAQHPEIRVVGYVPESDLPALYAGAAVFCYVSLEEGFGLPVLEAMAAGVPVLTSQRSSLPEVGGDAALYVDPVDVDAIRDGLQRLLEDSALRNDLSSRGRRRAATFTWERTARETLEVLEHAAPAT